MWQLDYTESWALKNWCFWTVVLEKTLESPMHTRRPNLSILKEISPECSLEGLMLKLKLQYFGHVMWRADSLEKTLMLGKIEGGRRWQRDDTRWDGWMASLTRWTWVWVNSRRWCWTGRPGVLQFMEPQRIQTERLNWTELIRLFRNTMDFSLSGILQARTLEWVAFSFSRESSRLRDQTHVSCILWLILYHWATRKAPYSLRHILKVELLSSRVLVLYNLITKLLSKRVGLIYTPLGVYNKVLNLKAFAKKILLSHPTSPYFTFCGDWK